MKEEAKLNCIPSLSSSPSSPSGRLTGLRSFCRPADLQVELGDLIEIDRTIYTHWGLYVGDGEIVHVSGPKSDISSSESFVRRSFLKEVAGDCLVRVNNKEVPAKERGLECLTLEEILSRSLNSVGQSVPYNFLTKNVEHYVTEWRYGVGWSDQTKIFDFFPLSGVIFFFSTLSFALFLPPPSLSHTLTHTLYSSISILLSFFLNPFLSLSILFFLTSLPSLPVTFILLTLFLTQSMCMVLLLYLSHSQSIIFTSFLIFSILSFSLHHLFISFFNLFSLSSPLIVSP
ncbi:unnamed protein product [Acanthosepion pharaonis]|uniref:LRAT domain-containing protein n=1 Tax=Acanthosepion pharaonis TaxID=158019 RepID=A0A812D1W8_ACAPH|nr:unnamed protein product [Sepia pharaonis]